MTDDTPNGLTVTVSETVIDLTLVYPDGSQLQLTMPKPQGIEAQTREQIETLAQRMARRLLGVALEDLGGAAGS